jgi:membrane fusion protein (multidrug efflux system)
MTDAPPMQQRSVGSPALTERPASPPPRTRANRRSLILGIVVVLLLSGIGAYFLLPGLYEDETDDAYVEAHLVSFIPKVPAYIATLHVDDNSKVAAGDLLIELGPRDYLVQVELARANVTAAEAKLEGARDQIAVTDANTGQNRAELGLGLVWASAAICGRWGSMHRGGLTSSAASVVPSRLLTHRIRPSSRIAATSR